MSSVQTLPPELWLIIFDFVVAASIGLLQHSNHITFPEALDQFRHPWTYPPTGIPSLSSVRLVCRAFNDLVAPTPYLFLKSKDTPISNGTRAVFISSRKDAQVLLEHLLVEPSKSQRIVMLDMAVYNSNPYLPVLFDSLCENAHSLPNLESLTLTLPVYDARARPLPKFWSRLNNSFPHLVCLVLLGRLKLVSEPEPVIFERLKIIDFDNALVEWALQFPMLRHAGFTTDYSASRFTRWGFLESLLIRGVEDYTSRFDFWDLVPRLVLLGVPSKSAGAFAGVLPSQHPLQHLYIYVGTVPRNDHDRDPEREDKELAWLKAVLKKLPTVKRLTLAYPPVSNYRSSSIWGDFDEEELALMGFIRDHSHMQGSHKDRRMVLRRLDINPRIDPPIGATSRHNGARAGWDRFSGFVSRKFHF
jgi:hypothetical protein